MEHKVVAAIHCQVEPVAAGFADLQERLHLLALECRESGVTGGRGAVRHLVVHCVQQRVPDAQSGAAKAVAREYVVRGQLAGDGVVRQVPLDAQIVDGLEANARSDGSNVARRSEKGRRHQVQRGIEHIAPARNDCSAKVRIDKVFLRDLPARPLARRAGADDGFPGIARGVNVGVGAGILFACAARFFVCRPQIEPLRDGEAALIHVAGNIGGIEQEHILGLGADSAHIPVVQFRLDHVAQFPVPERKLVIPFQRRQTDVDRCLQVRPIERFVTDDGRGEWAGESGRLADGVHGVAQRHFRQEAPTCH